MHKAPANEEVGQVPPKELIKGMGQLIGEASKNGTLLAGDGLKPGPTRHVLTFGNGRCDVKRGTRSGEGQLPQRIVVLEVRTEADAVEWARRFGEAVGAARLELGPVTEAWDLGLGTRPPDAPFRFMIVQPATREYEAGKQPTGAQQQGLRTVIAEMQKAGVLRFNEALLPSSKAVRLNYRDHVLTRTDGPFTESKELIGGFCMLRMRSFDEMIVWADRYARILGGTLEIDLRVAADGEGSEP
ncbi:MAG TPA: YciI family protein [Planctomycetota bacterium]|nr:YciI family protein [Planctomycetota bacterium]